MFTGIIEAVGSIGRIEHRDGDVRMEIFSDEPYLDDVALGDSVAVSGICLTVQERIERGFAADLSLETLQATSSGGWTRGRRVNLEKALTASKPLGGHLVSGHVDGLARLLDRREDARSWRLRFEVPADLARYVARKGSVTLDGVSLTVNEVHDSPAAAAGGVFGVNIIPHTLSHTTLGDLQPGDAVNLEVDLVARYLERLLAARTGS